MTQDQTQTQTQAEIETGHAVEMQPVACAEPTLEDLLREQDELEQRIKAKAKAQRPSDLAEARRLVTLHGFTARELGIVEPVGVVESLPASAAPQQAPAEPKKVPAKYKHPETGDTWTGRGLKPKWLEQALAEGKSLEDFLIPAPAAEVEA